MEADKRASRVVTYDVALSFAGEDREFVQRAAAAMRSKGIRVFYDRYSEAELWGKDLYTYLRDVYEKQASFTVVFVSRHYARKLWARHERESAQARAFEERREYILPARFDDTEVPGLPATIGYVDLREKTPEQLAALVEEKLAKTLNRKRRPRHRMVSEALGWDELASEVVFDISRGEDKRWVVVDPFAYQSLGALLDDLFLNYLTADVSPYSYGSEWVLLGAPDDTRVVAPLEWIGVAGKPIMEVCPNWAVTRGLHSEGLIPGTQWALWFIKQRSGGLLEELYGLVTNDEQLTSVITSNRKAVSFLLGRHLVLRSLADVRVSEFEFQYVFMDWMGAPHGKILVHEGMPLDEEILRIFRRR